MGVLPLFGATGAKETARTSQFSNDENSILGWEGTTLVSILLTCKMSLAMRVAWL